MFLRRRLQTLEPERRIEDKPHRPDRVSLSVQRHGVDGPRVVTIPVPPLRKIRGVRHAIIHDIRLVAEPIRFIQKILGGRHREVKPAQAEAQPLHEGAFLEGGGVGDMKSVISEMGHGGGFGGFF
jgi:hypothetical protein